MIISDKNIFKSMYNKEAGTILSRSMCCCKRDSIVAQLSRHKFNLFIMN